MEITREVLVSKLSNYLDQLITLAELGSVDIWAKQIESSRWLGRERQSKSTVVTTQAVRLRADELTGVTVSRLGPKQSTRSPSIDYRASRIGQRGVAAT